ncbi:putative multicopper oxidase family protein [Lyophyllum shimeji]|uniref:laccase n=1 Tax=Lyophyllum shimeji TaxID=47721 RepID=A0A9P3PUU9_LYOSH|nr:putative multicopper oxidase family protein [Lyophyllum shimeji]
MFLMFSAITRLALPAISLFGLANAVAIGPDSTLVISNKVISPDGFPRAAVLAGGTFPGPVIIGKKGDRFRLNVVNQLTDKTMLLSTSIHWHGIFQRVRNWADGAAFVTQCPITPNSSFVYDFSVVGQTGTYWYHSHLSTQYCDGLRGAFVVKSDNEPYINDYDVDDESTIITLADWFHKPAPEQTGIVPAPNPDSTLINGKGRYLSAPGKPVDLAVINVVKGKRYRFRIVGMSCDAAFTFSIDKHIFKIIEADGEETAPLVVDSFQVFAGQRYSAIMAADQPVGNYWIRANPDRGNQGFAGGINSAILRYAGAPVAEPTTPFTPSTRPLKEFDLRALIAPKPPGKPHVGGADVNINLAHHFNLDTLLYEVNGVSFESPTVPVLLQILKGKYAAQDLLPKGSVYTLPPNQTIEVSMPPVGAQRGGPHPFHLHGHSFWVIRSAGSSVYNYNNPVRRDTIDTGDLGDNATIRFVTDNSGPWFLHCHIDWHIDLGLAIVFAENPAGTADHIKPIPPAWDQLCPKYDALPPSQLGGVH